MDMSLAKQAASAEWMVRSQASLESKVYDVPNKLDAEVSRLSWPPRM
jgi:S-adenosylhomocysteine hydrolase